MINPSPTDGQPTGRPGRDPWWVGPLEMVLPVLLTAGLVLASDVEWRQVFEVVLLPLVGWYAWRYGLGGRRAVWVLAVPLAWIAWLGLSGGWGSAVAPAEWSIAAIEALQTGMFFVLCVIFIRVTPLPRLEGIAVAFVLAAAWALFRGLFEHVDAHGVSLAQRLDGRGLFSNPNRGSALACLMLILAMYLAASTQSRFVRVTSLLYMPLAAIYVLFTGSRGGFVVLAGTILAYLVVSGGRAAAARFLLIAGMILGGALAVLVLVPAAGAPVWDNLTRNVYRAEIWAETWRITMERPFLGLGYGFDERLLDRFAHPHNLHLSNLFYGGIPAVVLGVATLGMAVLQAVALPDRRCRALTVAALSLVLIWTIPNGGVPISRPDDDWYHFWIPIALASGLARRAREQRA